MLEEGWKMKSAISWTMIRKKKRVIPNSSRGVEDAANGPKMTILWGGQFESMVTSEVYSVLI